MQLCLLNVILGFILLAVIDCNKPPTTGIANYCYQAKDCTHDHKQKCGINKKKKLRRFHDACSMLRFNCRFHDNYTVTKMVACKGLPPFKKKLLQPREKVITSLGYYPKLHVRGGIDTTTTLHPLGLTQVITKMWCWIGRHCHVTNNVICGRDSRMVHMVFQSNCSMAKFNCDMGFGKF
ncbi:uncharacterized protein LOC128678311 isoform X3 [Plodia interpunctella]|uniref:uncharacterized protein LOC128678311 isoform X3 n=1 Tax=Plodia interpunctella TaxID=58824 RepID=UPI002368A8BC|nr:uncharacterized protein LOC128678311 isoform X3 [Plodia interpunctella]